MNAIRQLHPARKLSRAEAAECFAKLLAYVESLTFAADEARKKKQQ